MTDRLLELKIDQESDIIAARQRARQVSALVGLDTQNQIRVATAVSELVRNALVHGGGGNLTLGLAAGGGRPARLEIVIRDHGPGLGRGARGLEGGDQGFGIAAAQRLMDSSRIESHPGQGTTITLDKYLPKALNSVRFTEINRELARQRPGNAFGEMQDQNRELLRSLDELRLRQDELSRLNHELEDTNRGVMALYAELDERATQLKVADDVKSRFLSSVSHEFRTPVNSILALSQILLHRLDGDLTAEQNRQVGYIRQAAEQLSTLIDDLLDLRKAEAGKIPLRVEAFTIVDLFGALRGMFKPLATNEAVTLAIEDPVDPPELMTDQGKVSQILRNLISNALKFTQRGSVRVTATCSTDRETIVFTVADTGIGIAPENHRRVFEEFAQVENTLQTRVKGTGLGLPLSQRLAGLLGGGIELVSAVGEGSAFSLAIPTRLQSRGDVQFGSALSAPRLGPARILIIDDSEIERYALRQFLPQGQYEVMEATGGYDGLRLARQYHPEVIFLDVIMPDIDGRELLSLLRASTETSKIPVILFTSQTLDMGADARLSAASALLPKQNLSRESVAALLRRVREPSEASHATPL